MKAKYYPHITAAGALLLTITPLCFVLSLSRQAPTDGLLPAAEVLDARVDSHSADTAFVLTEESAFERATPVTPLTAFEPSVPSVSPPSAPPRRFCFAGNAGRHAARAITGAHGWDECHVRRLSGDGHGSAERS